MLFFERIMHQTMFHHLQHHQYKQKIDDMSRPVGLCKILCMNGNFILEIEVASPFIDYFSKQQCVQPFLSVKEFVNKWTYAISHYFYIYEFLSYRWNELLTVKLGLEDKCFITRKVIYNFYFHFLHFCFKLCFVVIC